MFQTAECSKKQKVLGSKLFQEAKGMLQSSGKWILVDIFFQNGWTLVDILGEFYWMVKFFDQIAWILADDLGEF